MKLTRALFGFVLIFSATPFVASCGEQQTATSPAETNSKTVSREQDEAAIRSLDAEWVKAVAAKDADKSASFYNEHGTLMAPGEKVATGTDEIRKTWTAMMATPGFALTFSPITIHVSQSGDMAYELGTFELMTNDKKGKPQTMKANYVVVWGKQADRSWKALVDAPTTTQ